MDNDKLEAIKSILKNNYEGEVLEECTNFCACELYDVLFVSMCPLFDTISIILEYEFELGIEDGDSFYVFDQLTDLLEEGEVNARRLYDCFMNDLDLLELYLKIIDNSEYLSSDEIAEATQKAFGLFDKEVLAFCGIVETEEED